MSLSSFQTSLKWFEGCFNTNQVWASKLWRARHRFFISAITHAASVWSTASGAKCRILWWKSCFSLELRLGAVSRCLWNCGLSWNDCQILASFSVEKMIFFSSSSKYEITYKLKLNAEKELLSYTSPPLRYSKLMWLLVTWNPPRKYVVRRHTHRGNYIFHAVCHGFPFPHRVYNVDMLHSEEKSHHTSTTVLLTSSLPPSFFLIRL